MGAISFDSYKSELSLFKKFVKDHNDVLGFYVYALADTRNNKHQVFYIGKGRRCRMFDHIRDAFKNDKIYEGTDNVSRKIRRIQDIHEAGYKVELSIVHYGLTEEHAFLLESALIDVFSNYKEIDPLAIAEMTNIAEGFDH